MNGAGEFHKRKRIRRRRDHHRFRERDLRRKRYIGEIFLPHLSDGWKERDERTVHIGRLPYAVKRKEDVAKVFSFFGPIAHIHIQPDLKFGFIHFEEERCATRALEAQSVELFGTQVQVRTAAKKRGASPQAGYEDHAPSDAEAHSGDPDDVSEEDAPSDAGAEDPQVSGASQPAAEAADSDPLLEFWSERDMHSGEGSNAMDGCSNESQEVLEEKLQALRVACIHTLDTHDGELMLNELGQEELIVEQKSSLPSMPLLRVVRAFSDNFTAEDKGSGQYLIKLLSTDDSDTSKIDELVAEIYRSRRSVKDQSKDRDKPADSNRATVVAGPLSDGWKERDERTVYVGRLPYAVKTKRDVTDAFERKFGRVVHVHIQSDLQFGFIHFEDVRSAEAAIEARLIDVCGTSVEVRSAGRQGGPVPRHRAGDRPPLRGSWPASMAEGEHRMLRGGARWGAEPPRLRGDIDHRSREPLFPGGTSRRPSPDRHRKYGEGPPDRWSSRSMGAPQAFAAARERYKPPLSPPRPPPRRREVPPAPPPRGPSPPPPPQEIARKVFYPKAVSAAPPIPPRRPPAATGPPPVRPSMAPYLEEESRPTKLAKTAAAPPAKAQQQQQQQQQQQPSLPSARLSWPSTNEVAPPPPRMSLPMPSASSKPGPMQRGKVPLPMPPAKGQQPRPTFEPTLDERDRKRGRSPA